MNFLNAILYLFVSLYGAGVMRSTFVLLYSVLLNTVSVINISPVPAPWSQGLKHTADKSYYGMRCCSIPSERGIFCQCIRLLPTHYCEEVREILILNGSPGLEI